MCHYLVIIIAVTYIGLCTAQPSLAQETTTHKIENQDKNQLKKETIRSTGEQTSSLSAYNFYLLLRTQNPEITKAQALKMLQENGYTCTEKDLTTFDSLSYPVLNLLKKREDQQVAEKTGQAVRLVTTLKELVENEILKGTALEFIHKEVVRQFGSNIIGLEDIQAIAREIKTKLSSFMGRNTIPITNIQSLIQHSKHTGKLIEKYPEIIQQYEDPLGQYKALERYEKELDLQQFNIDIPSVDPDSYIGQIHDELQEFVDQYLHPDKYSVELLKNKQGLLLLGKPGTGKTYTARYIAKLLDAGFIEINCSQLLEGIVGESEKKVERLVEAVETYSELYGRPCIIFLDELDTIGRKRGIRGMEHIHTTLNRLLSIIEQKSSNRKIIFLAATNSEKKDLDSALIRSGRFGKHIEFKLPKRNERIHYLQEFLKKLNPNYHQTDINVQILASLTDGFSQADLSGIVIEACKKSAFHNQQLTMQFLLREIDVLHTTKREQRIQQTTIGTE